MKLSEAISYFGNKNRLAMAIGVSRMAVTNWGETIPLQRQLQLQILTQGKLKAELPSNWTPNI